MGICHQEEQHALQTVTCERDLLSRLVAIAQKLGFDYCAYGLRTPIPLTSPKTIIINNYPIAWQQRYQEQQYLNTDPTVRHGLRSVTPLIWSEDVFSLARPFWEEARTFGLTVGWAQGHRDINGVIGMLTLARSAEPFSSTELEEKNSTMAWLAEEAHQAMSRLLIPKLLPEANAQLSDREIEILRWTGDGKTSSEIAHILLISERTANFHINNAMIKLHAANKTAAALKATLLGLLK